MRERIAQTLYLPLILFGIAYLTAPYQASLPLLLTEALAQGIYWMLLLIGILSIIFNRSKVLLTIITIALMHWFFKFSQSTSASILLASTFVPLNLLFILIYKERRISSITTLVRLSIIGAQAFGIYYIIDQVSIPEIDTIASYYAINIITTAGNWPAFLQTSQPLFAILGFTLCLTLAKTIHNDTPINQGIFGACIGCISMLLFQFTEDINNVFYWVIAIVLGHGLFRDYYNMAYKDELTGLPQRRALNEQLQSLGKTYSLAMLDVDHFKKFNDTHGHDIGDEVLQMVAGQIKKVEGGGKAYRYGGEEFTIVFAGMQSHDAIYYLEKVRESIEKYDMVVRDKERPEHTSNPKKPDKASKKSRSKGSFRNAKKTVSVTISIGVAEKSFKQDRPQDVLKRADEALYKAKKDGRNKVVIDETK